MKRGIISFLFIVFVNFGFTQNKQLLYGFSELPQSLLQNPGGKIDNYWYFGVPLLSHIHFNAGSSGITVYDLFAENDIDFTEKLRRAIYSMTSRDFSTFTQQLEIFSGGFAYGNSFEKDKYISFGLYQETDFIGYFPQDFAILAYEGNFNNRNRLFQADHFNISAELISVLHVGFNKKVNEKFTFGIRGKIYSSVVNINSTRNKGGFVTQAGENNLLQHVFNLDLGVRTSGIATMLNDDNSDVSEDVKTLRKQFLFGGNLGLGVDLGVTHQINDQWHIDASLLDIGFIRHKKEVENYQVQGDYVYEGIDPLFASAQGQTADGYWSDIEDDFEELFEVDTIRTAYTTMRPIKFNASLNYSFGKKKLKECNCTNEDEGYLNAVGWQLYAINRPKAPQLALTAYYYRRLLNGLDIKAAYTIDSYSFSNLGLGISASLLGLNIYAMADNLLSLNNVYDAQSVSLQLGINYVFKKDEN
ncbi:DUF5723 family protein [Seonamhaeicola sp. ML3]|uniref:DUF5723 family protein n=1 Tax=Seonamhaeicola sp. ML3 TaxID=2937786 RepID=UPI00200F22B9|nr:DUF5723 family protein [Seonamhaeicola sp. ML3]